MNPPLLTYELYEDFIRCVCASNDGEKAQAIASVLAQLPASHHRKLEGLVRHLRRVAAEETSNRMSLENLALVFGPTIMRSPDGLRGDLADNGHQILVAKAILSLPLDLWNNAISFRRRSTTFGGIRTAHTPGMRRSSGAQVPRINLVHKTLDLEKVEEETGDDLELEGINISSRIKELKLRVGLCCICRACRVIWFPRRLLTLFSPTPPPSPPSLPRPENLAKVRRARRGKFLRNRHDAYVAMYLTRPSRASCRAQRTRRRLH
jgi:hypothetical protein